MKKQIWRMGFVLLIFLALAFPKILFSVQDRNLLENTELGSRGSLLDSQGDTYYTLSAYDRLSNLAAMTFDSATITSIGYDVSEDEQLAEKLFLLLDGEWTTWIDEMTIGVYHEIFQNLSEGQIENCKKYIIYQSDQGESIALLMWYFEWYLPDMGSRVKVLADSETDMIYGIQILADGDTLSDGYSAGNGYIVLEDEKTNVLIQYEMLYSCADQLACRWEEFQDYYDTAVKRMEADSAESMWYRDILVDQENGRVALFLPYGELNLDLQIQIVQRKDGYPEFSFGITHIQKRIPEVILE